MSLRASRLSAHYLYTLRDLESVPPELSHSELLRGMSRDFESLMNCSSHWIISFTICFVL